MLLDNTMLLMMIGVLILSFYAQSKVRGNYNKYKKKPNAHGITGAETARKILDRNGLYDVKIVPIKGTLTDHYDPRNRTVSLSEDIYYGKSISSMSIAAHEVGHAIQHATNYVPLNFRTMIVPIASLGSRAAFPLFLIGLLLRLPALLNIAIIFFSLALLFHIVTLPVEYNASNRALAEMSNGLITTNEDITGAKKVLNAAALTYVASALMALLQLLRYLRLARRR